MKRFLLLALLLLACIPMVAQDAALESISVQQLQVFRQQQENLKESPSFNEIYIEQIGRGNTARVNANAERSLMALRQQGARNQIRLELSALDLSYSVWQEGRRNSLTEYNLGNSETLTRLVEQLGNNNQLVIHGQNSISDEMQVKMGSGNQTVIIRNFN